MDNKTYNNVLEMFKPFDLKTLDSRNLLTRFDTKYILDIEQLELLLNVLKSDYEILELNDLRQFHYHNIYYDTNNLNLYLDHHNNKSNRFKIRYREYADSGDVFIEIKKRINNLKTYKIRRQTDTINKRFDSGTTNFLDSNSDVNSSELSPVLDISYDRITLLNKTGSEKITIDTDIKFVNGISSADAEGLVILELKQKKLKKTEFERIVRRFNGKKIRVSKYVLGTLLTHDKIKYNRFKEKIIMINKVRDGIFNH